MALTVIEVLENALYDLTKATMGFEREIGKNLLENAIKQLWRNPDASADFDQDAAEEN